MALVKCKECGREMSSEAKACPQCGHVVKRTGLVTKIVAALFGIGILTSIVGSLMNSHEESKKTEAEAQRVAALSPEQRAVEAKARQEKAAAAAVAQKAQVARKAKDDAMFTVAMALAIAIKKTANDPDSIKVYETAYTDDGAIYLLYRGKNAFNATIANTVVRSPKGEIANGTEQQIATLWNKYIANKPLHTLPNP